MKLKLSTEQVPVYAIFNKRFDQKRCSEFAKTHVAKEEYYLPNEPVPRFDLSTMSYPENKKQKHWTMSKPIVYTEMGEAESILQICENPKFVEVLGFYVNKRVMPEGSSFQAEQMVWLFTSSYGIEIYGVGLYLELLQKAHLPLWADMELLSRGTQIIMPMSKFQEQFSIEVKPKYLEELTAE